MFTFGLLRVLASVFFFRVIIVKLPDEIFLQPEVAGK
jgi:hypothetical protein